MGGGLTTELLLSSDYKLFVKFDIIEYIGKNSVNFKATDIELVRKEKLSPGLKNEV